jgi:putative membrane protein
MIADALAAYAHFVSIFLAVSCLAAELILYRPAMPGAIVRRLRRIDAGYGLAAILMVVTGLLRLFEIGKGSDFYFNNGIFWLKMVLVATVAVLSALPTAHILRLPHKAPEMMVTVDRKAYRRIRTTLWAEAILFALIPLAATLMARGIGLER